MSSLNDSTAIPLEKTRSFSQAMEEHELGVTADGVQLADVKPVTETAGEFQAHPYAMPIATAVDDVTPSAEDYKDNDTVLPHTVNSQEPTTPNQPALLSSVKVEQPGGPPGPPVNPNELHGKPFAFLFLGLALAIFLAALDQSIVATALPKISTDLGNLTQLPWVATAYLLTTTAFQPLYGRFSDIFGRKPVILFAIFMFEFGSLMCGLAQSMIWLIICRAIQGIGGGGLISMVFVIITDVVAFKDRGKYQGIIGAAFGLASVTGPLLGGAFTDHVTWRWCFFINLPFGVICVGVVLMYLNLPRPKGNIRDKLLKIDYLGVATLIPAVVALLLATNWGGQTYAWDSAIVISLYVVAGVFIVSFILIEYYVAKAPIVQVRMFKVRNIVVVTTINFLLGIVMMGTTIYLPIYFQIVKGDSATASGLRMIAMMLPLVITSITSGNVVSKTGLPFPWLYVGTALLVLGCGILSILGIHDSFGQMVGKLIPLGVGLGCCLQVILLITQSSVVRTEIASATTTVTFCRSIGFVVGVAIVSAIVDNFVNSKLEGTGYSNRDIKTGNVPEVVRVAYDEACQRAFQVLIAFAGVSFIAALCVQRISFSAMTANIKGGPGGPGGPPAAKKVEDAPVVMAE